MGLPHPRAGWPKHPASGEGTGWRGESQSASCGGQKEGATRNGQRPTLYAKSNIQGLKLEIDKGSNFGRHIFHYELNYDDEAAEFYKPGRFYENSLAFIGKGLRNEMKDDKQKHHHAPFRSDHKEMRNLCSVEICKDTPNNKHWILKRGGTEEHP